MATRLKKIQLIATLSHVNMQDILMHLCVKFEVSLTDDVVAINTNETKYGYHIQNISHSNLDFCLGAI